MSAARVPTGTVEPSRPGAPWWRYRRPKLPARPLERPEPAGDPNAAPPLPGDRAEDPSHRQPTGLEGAGAPDGGGLLPGVLAVMCIAAVVATGRMEIPGIGRALIPAAGILAAVAFGHVLIRRHPDEKWLATLLVLGVVVKLVASVIRYDTLVDEYEGQGDASGYDKIGRQFFEAWKNGDEPPDIAQSGSAATSWVKWFTGVVYYLFGPDMLNGFLIFGLLAVVGSYLWYRATVEAVPFVDKRLYFLLVFFVPSIAFWPSGLGKEALMQLGIGVVALGTAYLVNQQILRGFLIALPGGWLLWRVRPHLLAFVTFAAGVAYVTGRAARRGASAGTSILRPLGIVVVAFLVFFAANEGAEFLGMDDLSINSVEQELDEQTGRTATGGSRVQPADQTEETTITPLTLPQGIVTVLLRPFPWEVDSSLQIIASLEAAAVAALIGYRIRSVTLSLRRGRTTPFLLYCWTLVLLYAVAFSTVSNWGLLVRQRSLVLPALFVLVAVDPALASAADRRPRSLTVPNAGLGRTG